MHWITLHAFPITALCTLDLQSSEKDKNQGVEWGSRSENHPSVSDIRWFTNRSKMFQQSLFAIFSRKEHFRISIPRPCYPGFRRMPINWKQEVQLCWWLMDKSSRTGMAVGCMFIHGLAMKVLHRACIYFIRRSCEELVSRAISHVISRWSYDVVEALKRELYEKDDTLTLVQWISRGHLATYLLFISNNEADHKFIYHLFGCWPCWNWEKHLSRHLTLEIHYLHSLQSLHSFHNPLWESR